MVAWTKGATSVVSKQQVVVTQQAVTPTSDELAIMLERQVDRLIEIGAPYEAKIDQDKYRDELITATKAFVWRPELAEIGLSEIAIVDYRLSGKFLAEAGGVYYYIDPDCRNYEGVITPDGVLVIQTQWGEKYRNKKPRWCRDNFHDLEQGGIVLEGLVAYLYGGEDLLKKCYMDLPGSISEGGFVPCLSWNDGRARLNVSFGSGASPCCGSVSRGK